MFGVNAELLIDRAWGWEPTTIADIREYKPSSNSMSVGQVLHCPYDYEKAKLIVKEMIDQHALDLFAKGLVTDQLVLDIGYDIENLTDPERSSKYHGEVTTDRYGRKVPKHAHGTVNLQTKTSSSRVMTQAVVDLYDRIVDRNLLIRRINIAACKLTLESDICERENLTRLIEDAKSGKIDHICIYSLWDFWHSPKKLVDTINELKSLSAPVGIRFYHCSTPCVFDKCTLNEKEYGVIIQESEKVEQIEKDFISAQSNKGILTRGLTRAVIKSHIDSIMLLEFFNDYFIIPFEPTWQEIQIELGTSEEDSMAIHDIWSPSEDGLNKIIKWGSQKILQYYLT